MFAFSLHCSNTHCDEQFNWMGLDAIAKPNFHNTFLCGRKNSTHSDIVQDLIFKKGKQYSETSVWNRRCVECDTLLYVWWWDIIAHLILSDRFINVQVHYSSLFSLNTNTLPCVGYYYFFQVMKLHACVSLNDASVCVFIYIDTSRVNYWSANSVVLKVFSFKWPMWKEIKLYLRNSFTQRHTRTASVMVKIQLIYGKQKIPLR